MCTDRALSKEATSRPLKVGAHAFSTFGVWDLEKEPRSSLGDGWPMLSNTGAGGLVTSDGPDNGRQVAWTREPFGRNQRATWRTLSVTHRPDGYLGMDAGLQSSKR